MERRVVRLLLRRVISIDSLCAFAKSIEVGDSIIIIGIEWNKSTMIASMHENTMTFVTMLYFPMLQYFKIFKLRKSFCGSAEER